MKTVLWYMGTGISVSVLALEAIIRCNKGCLQRLTKVVCMLIMCLLYGEE